MEDEGPEVSLLPPSDGGDQGDHGDHGDAGAPRRGVSAGMVALLVVAAVGLALVGRGGEPTPTAPLAVPPDPPAARTGPPIPTGPDARGIQPARVGDGPVFDEATGMVIAIGSAGQEIHLIDLDTGDVSPLGRRGTPRLIEDGRLLNQVADDRWEAIDLATGDARPIEPGADRGPYTSIAAAEADGVWFGHADGDDGRTWSRVAPATGDLLQQVTVPSGTRVATGSDGQPLAGPEIVGSDRGEIYALDPDGGYRRQLDGQLVGFNERLVLVAACGVLSCSNHWVDRASLEAIDLPAPDNPLAGAIIRDDTILVAEAAGGPSRIVKVFDIATNRAVATGSPSGLARSWVSPSGRFIAVPGFNALLITDLEAGRTATIDRLDVGTDVRLAWGRA